MWASAWKIDPVYGWTGAKMPLKMIPPERRFVKATSVTIPSIGTGVSIFASRVTVVPLIGPFGPMTPAEAVRLDFRMGYATPAVRPNWNDGLWKKLKRMSAYGS